VRFGTAAGTLTRHPSIIAGTNKDPAEPNTQERVMTISINRKTILSLVAAATMGGAIATSTSSAEAGWRGGGRGYGHGGAVAAGLVGGLALGAIASHGYRPYPYYGPVVVTRDCYTVRRKVWTDYGWRRVRQTVCD
jgi:hypothetical protein